MYNSDIDSFIRFIAGHFSITLKLEKKKKKKRNNVLQGECSECTDVLSLLILLMHLGQ